MHIDLPATWPNTPGRVALSGCAGAARGGAHVYQMTFVCTMQPVFPTWPKSAGGVGEKKLRPSFFRPWSSADQQCKCGRVVLSEYLGTVRIRPNLYQKPFVYTSDRPEKPFSTMAQNVGRGEALSQLLLFVARSYRRGEAGVFVQD